MDSTASTDEELSCDAWSVIEFINTENESNAVEVVPTSWIIFTKNKIMCKWPEKNARKYILQKKPPKDNWKNYIVQLISRTDSYKKAVDIVHRKTQTDTSDTSCSQLGRGKRKRKTKYICNFSDYVSSPEMTPPPSITVMDSQNKQLNDLNKSIENMDKPAINSDKKIADIASEKHITLEDAAASANNVISIPKDDASPVNNVTSIPKDAATPANNVTPIPKDAATPVNNVRSIPKDAAAPVNNMTSIEITKDFWTDSQNIVSILQNTIAVKKLLEQQNAFLIHLERTSNPLSVASASNYNINNTLSIIPKKPFKKFKKLLDFDIALQANEEGEYQMETFFYLLGGTSPQNHIKLGLEKIFTNKLSAKCSWLGRKGNFEVNTLIIMDILKRSTRKHFPLLTDKQFQNHVSTWFTYSKIRYRKLAKQQCH